MHVADWLRDDCKMHLVAPIAVKIGREIYHGASYFEPPEEGRQRTEPILYLLGNVPVAYKRSHRVCWRFGDEQRDWYLAAFADAAVARALSNCHPFGAWFQLRQWPHGHDPYTGGEWETIDHYNDRPYKRLPITEVHV